MKIRYLILFLLFLASCKPPLPDCPICDLELEVGDCSTDSTYNLTVDFQTSLSGDFQVLMYGQDGIVIEKTYSDFPLTFENFQGENQHPVPPPVPPICTSWAHDCTPHPWMHELPQLRITITVIRHPV